MSKTKLIFPLQNLLFFQSFLCPFNDGLVLTISISTRLAISLSPTSRVQVPFNSAFSSPGPLLLTLDTTLIASHLESHTSLLSPCFQGSSCYITLYTGGRIILLMVRSSCHSGHICSLTHHYLQNKNHLPS